jgi:anti-sigma regulatory factor (Ser/Thr protein kinase)
MATQAAMGRISTAHTDSALTLLANVSRILTSSLDYRATLNDVAALVAGSLAAGCVIEIQDEYHEPLAFRAGNQLGRNGRCLESQIALRGHGFGVLKLFDSGAIEDEAVFRTVAEEVALRIAVAIDAAHVHAREHRATDALQRALLPETLPSSGAYALHAAYIPASAEAVVGGDWYDAFSLPDGRVALSIGDVAGHGLRAATIMGEVRQALRASALDPKSPAAVLERANAIMNMRANPVMVTAIFGIYDPARSVLTYATAGHPSPILGLRDGWTASLPTYGIPLGIGNEFESFDWTFTIPPGSILAFFTDGLIEHHRDVIAGENSLLAAVATEVVSMTASPARSLQERVLGQERNSDDVATLTLAVTDVPASDVLDLTCSAIPLAAPLIRHALVDFARRLGLAESARFDLVTTIGEAVANAAEHAYGERPGVVRIRVEHADDALRVLIEDHGRWKPTTRREERGRGLRLMRALSQGLQIMSDSNGTSIRLTLPVARTV